MCRSGQRSWNARASAASQRCRKTMAIAKVARRSGFSGPAATVRSKVGYVLTHLDIREASRKEEPRTPATIGSGRILAMRHVAATGICDLCSTGTTPRPRFGALLFWDVARRKTY